MENSCVFLGPLELPQDHAELEASLRETIEELVTRHDIHNFFIGNTGAFDTLVERIFDDLEETYPFLSLDYYNTSLPEDALDLVIDGDPDRKYETVYEFASLCMAVNCTAVIAYTNCDDHFIRPLLDAVGEDKLVYNLGSYMPGTPS